ncbi:hypothetical protein BDV93DRAFT_559140 [Ceratobasidium sp. AG-I]|nr:hypothetical protein BDV93DRAFT_559140 [Ceratobasidium sp. AG-I]
MLFKMNLKQLISVLEPIARAIKCLESTQSTLVDIFVFWQAVLGRILELFLHSNSGFSNAEQTQIRRAIIHHYNETIHDAPTNAYLTAFFLDPWCRDAPVYKELNPLSMTVRLRKSTANGSRSTVSQGSDNVAASSSLPPTVFQCILAQLLDILKQEMLLAETNKKHPLAVYDAQVARDDLEEQIHQYAAAEHPFHCPLGWQESTVAWWRAHMKSSDCFFLS